MGKIKHIFFDLDHTLWDFEKNSQEAIYEMFDKYELSKVVGFNRFLKKYKEINKRYWNLYQQEKVTKKQVREQRFIEALTFFKIENANELGLTLSQEYVNLSPYKTNLFPGTHETLSALKNNYKLHVITNGFVEVQHIKLTESKLSQYFDVIVCSEETGKKKPHKKVYEFALKKAKARPEESAMIGDNLKADVHGANKAGLKGVWFNPLFDDNLDKVVEINALSQLTELFPG